MTVLNMHFSLSLAILSIIQAILNGIRITIKPKNWKFGPEKSNMLKTLLPVR